LRTAEADIFLRFGRLRTIFFCCVAQATLHQMSSTQPFENERWSSRSIMRRALRGMRRADVF
jgi:hypothetical protein